MARKKIKIVTFLQESELGGIQAVHYYRAALPLQTLAKLDPKHFELRMITESQLYSLLSMWKSDLVDPHILDCDIVMISRLFSKRGLDGFIERVHEIGPIIVFDTDDDLTEDFRELGGIGEHFLATLKVMDHVTVSTPYLARRMEEYIGYRPTVLYNHVDVPWFSRASMASERKIDGLSIGFVGTSSHGKDWTFAVDALVQVAKENSNVTLLVAGYLPEYLQDAGFKVIAPVAYYDYPAITRQFDIVCCCLDPDDEFNKSKSAVKSIESMASARRVNGQIGGAVPVCTDMPVYRRVVQHGHNGLLTDNSDWYSTLTDLVRDKRLYNKLSINGYRWVKKNRDIHGGCREWARTYQKLVR